MSRKMNTPTSQKAPDEDKIVEMLSHFAPQPSPRLAQKMSSSPWLQPLPSPVRRLKASIVWVLVGLGVLFFILSVAFIPSLRVGASQLFHLFLSSSSNQLEVQVTLTSPGDVVNFSDPSNFPLSLLEVSNVAPFPVRELSALPAGLTFVGARYDSSYNAATLLYSSLEYKLFLTQRPVGKGADFFSIGSSAIVKHVKVGDLPAEFVVGGWKAVSTQPAPVDQATPVQLNISAVWENALDQYTLRWQADGIVYELRSNGEESPTQSGLINLANGLK